VRFIGKQKMQMPMRNLFTLKILINFINPDHTINQLSINSKEEFSEYKAPDYCVDNIMNFARSYRVTDSKSTGKIEMMLN